MKLYRVTLETHEPFRHIHKYVRALNINEAWELAPAKGAEYNSRVRKNKCVVHSVNFVEDVG